VLKGHGFHMNTICWVLEAHSCIPSYSGGRDKEDHGLKAVEANSLLDTLLKNPSQK
jgi:hypothetical protein